MMYFCYDNEIYGNTGGQRSSATPQGAFTSTTTHGKGEQKKDMMAIMAAHRIPYAATLSLANREDFLRKLRTARRTKGFRFLLMLSPCPTGWKSEPEESVDLIRHGVRCRINERPDGTPVAEYITRQRRYTSLKVDPQRVKASIRKQWHYLDAMARAFPADG